MDGNRLYGYSLSLTLVSHSPPPIQFLGLVSFCYLDVRRVADCLFPATSLAFQTAQILQTLPVSDRVIIPTWRLLI